MQRFGECQVVDFGSGRVAGYSMVQLISTSLISGHFANDTNNAYLDIFSCKGYDPAIVEDFIDGREFHVGVVGNGTIHMLPPAEIDYSAFDDIHDRLCTYESNFDKTSLAYHITKPKIPVALTDRQLAHMEEIVIAAYRATDCRDYARMDLRLRDGAFYVLDVNHNADISPDTSIVLGAGLIGLSYGIFGSFLINLAAQRHPIFRSFFQTTRTGELRCLEL